MAKKVLYLKLSAPEAWELTHFIDEQLETLGNLIGDVLVFY